VTIRLAAIERGEAGAGCARRRDVQP
jgi:hypothetical protein